MTLLWIQRIYYATMSVCWKFMLQLEGEEVEKVILFSNAALPGKRVESAS